MPLRCFMISFVALQCAALSLAAPALAQDQSPLKMTLLNVSEKGASKAHRKIKGVLAENENVEYKSDRSLTTNLDDYALNKKILQKRSLRKKFRKRIKRMMSEEKLEGLFLVDVYGRGRKLQLIVIGPDGSQLDDFKLGIKAGKPSSDQVFTLLNNAFGSLGPEVLKAREEAEEKDEPEEEPDEEPDEGSDGEVSQTITPKQEGDGRIKKAVNISVGLFAGQRNLEAVEINPENANAPFGLRHGSPYVGAGGDLDAVIMLFDGGQAALGLSLYGSYAQFTTIFVKQDTNENLELASTFSIVGGSLKYIRGLSTRFSFDAYGGAQLMSLTVEPNSNYTGNRYVSARLGVGLGLQLSEDAKLHAHGGTLPVFVADNSGGAFGTSPFSLGYEAGASFSFHLTESFFLSAQYTFQYLTPEYPEPVSSGIRPSSSTDVFHNGGLMIGLTI